MHVCRRSATCGAVSSGRGAALTGPRGRLTGSGQQSASSTGSCGAASSEYKDAPPGAEFFAMDRLIVVAAGPDIHFYRCALMSTCVEERIDAAQLLLQNAALPPVCIVAIHGVVQLYTLSCQSLSKAD